MEFTVPSLTINCPVQGVIPEREAVRYSLIASIRAAEGIDLRSEISAQIIPEITSEAVIEI